MRLRLWLCVYHVFHQRARARCQTATCRSSRARSLSATLMANYPFITRANVRVLQLALTCALVCHIRFESKHARAQKKLHCKAVDTRAIGTRSARQVARAKRTCAHHACAQIITNLAHRLRMRVRVSSHNERLEISTRAQTASSSGSLVRRAACLGRVIFSTQCALRLAVCARARETIELRARN